MLVQNIMKGRNWLALLAPDVLDGIATCEQPDGLTTDYLIKTCFSAVWFEPGYIDWPRSQRIWNALNAADQGYTNL